MRGLLLQLVLLLSMSLCYSAAAFWSIETAREIISALASDAVKKAFNKEDGGCKGLGSFCGKSEKRVRNSGNCTDPYFKQLSRDLGQVESKYLQPTPAQSRDKDFVQKIIVDDLIRPYLNANISNLFYTGSKYELTAVPGLSDFDLQYCFKTPLVGKVHATRVEDSKDPGWKTVIGGPPEVLDSKGFFSGVKTRRWMQSQLAKAVENLKGRKPELFDEIQIKLSYGGPAVTLTVINNLAEQEDRKMDIDVVICVQHEDMENGSDFDIVAKPYDKSHPERDAAMWRMSYSRREQQLLKSFNSQTEPDLRRKLVLYKILKVIKSKNSQLAAFASYFYKNALFKLHSQKPDARYWTKNQFPQRFVDYIGIISDALNDHYLGIYFNPKVNLLARESEKSISSVKRYLQRIIQTNCFVELFRDVLPDL